MRIYYYLILLLLLSLSAPAVLAQSSKPVPAKKTVAAQQKSHQARKKAKRKKKGTKANKNYEPEVTSYVEAGVNANAAKTDLANSYQRWTPGVQLSLQFNRKKRLNGQFSLSAGNVLSQNLRPQYAEDMPENVTPVNYVNTSFMVLNYGLQLNLIRRERFRLYVGQGIGIIRINPKDNEGNSLQEANRTRNTNESFNRVTITLPTQAGFNYFLNNGYGLGFSATWLHPSSDYIDNLSQLGTRKGNDNILSYKISLLIPLNRKKPGTTDQGEE